MAGNVSKVRWRGNTYNICGNELAEKADKNGFYETMGVGVSNNLTPYSSQSGVDQAIPFNLQGTGCGNGETQVDTGSYCQLKEKRGNTVVVNQLVQNPTFVDTSRWATQQQVTFTVANNVAHVVCGETITSSMGIYQNILEGYQIPSHKYLLLFTVKPSAATKISAYYAGAYFPIVDVAANTNYWYSGIITFPQSPQGRTLVLYINYGTSMVEGDYADISKVSLIDLTIWFGSNDKIPTHLLNHPEDFGRYYQGGLAYNAGTLVNADGGVLKTIGRNLFDKETMVINNAYVNDDTGIEISSAGYKCTDYIALPVGKSVYIKTEQTVNAWGAWYDAQKNYISRCSYYHLNPIQSAPANAAYLRLTIATSGTGNPDTFVVSLYYSGESGYDEYYPYEELASINTGSETLRSAGNAYDVKTPDGTITRNIGYVDLGTCTYYTNQTGANTYEATTSFSLAKANGINNFICAKMVYAQYADDGQYGIRGYGSSGAIAIRVPIDVASTPEAIKTAMSGVYLYYELATPTTESGTSYSETVTIDDFGSMQFVNTNGVPQGNLIFYPVDYKAFLDTAYNELDGDATQIAQKGELAVDDPDTIKGVLNLINAKIPAPPASDGAYKLTVTVSSGVATYSWEA